LIFFVSWYFYKVKKIDFYKSVKFLLFGSLVSSSYTIYEVVFTKISRADGFFTHPLTFGNAISLVIVLLFAFIITDSFHTRKGFYLSIILFVIFYIALILSLSRGPILFTTITILVLLMLRYKFKGIVFSLLIVTIFVSLIISNKTLKNRFDDFVNNSYKVSTSSFGTRIVLWKSSIQIIKDNPIFGIGYNIKKEFKKRIKVPVSSMAHSHNSYLTLAVYYGIPALVILLMILGILMYRFYCSENILIKFSGIGVIIAYMLDGLTENNFSDSEVLMLFCFIIGLLYGMLNRNQLQK